MASVDVRRADRGYGGQNAVEDSKKKSWEDAMQAASAAALAAKADPQTMLGFAVGKMLSRYLFNKGDNGGLSQKDIDAYNALHGANNGEAFSEGDGEVMKPAMGLLDLGNQKEPYKGNWGEQVNVAKDFFSPKEIKDPMSGLGIDISKYIKL